MLGFTLQEMGPFSGEAVTFYAQVSLTCQVGKLVKPWMEKLLWGVGHGHRKSGDTRRHRACYESLHTEDTTNPLTTSAFGASIPSWSCTNSYGNQISGTPGSPALAPGYCLCQHSRPLSFNTRYEKLFFFAFAQQ